MSVEKPPEPVSGPAGAIAVEASRERLSDLDEPPARTRTDFVEQAWRAFCSPRLMVVLTALFALAMGLRIFAHPQEEALAAIGASFADRPWIVTLHRVFELSAPFRSWWFTTVLLLLTLSSLASSIERLPRILLLVSRPELRLSDRVLGGLRNQRQAPRGDLDASKVKAEFQRSGYRVREIVENGTTYLFGERGAWTRFGAWLVHIALLLLCVGGIVSRILSSEGTLDLPENGGIQDFYRERMADGTLLRRPLGHFVRCDDFQLDTFADGSAPRFASELTILDLDGRELDKKKILVNDPLEFGGRTFSQATYSVRPDESRVRMTLRNLATGESKPINATPQQPFFLGDGEVRYTVVDYEREFGVLGEAVQVVREEGPLPKAGELATAEPAAAVKRSTFWVFAKYPEFDAKFRGDQFGLTFEKLEPVFVTGLRVGYDPGVPWVYGGFLLLGAGLVVAFSTAHRRVWARIEDGKLALAGAAHRNKDRFKTEFDALVQRLGVGAPAAGTAGSST